MPPRDDLIPGCASKGYEYELPPRAKNLPYLGAAAGRSTDPCNEKGDGNDAFDFCNSSGTSIGAAGGYLIGATAGIYGAGRLFGGEGSPWMTAGGAALGLLAGGLLSSRIDGIPVLQVMALRPQVEMTLARF